MELAEGLVALIDEEGMPQLEHPLRSADVVASEAEEVHLQQARGDEAALGRRFEREAQAAGEIGSDHILEVYDVGSLDDGARYMVMEYLDGESLAARWARNVMLNKWLEYCVERGHRFGVAGS